MPRSSATPSGRPGSAGPPSRPDAWPGRVATAWRSYWLAPGGRYAAAVLRVGIAVSVLWTLWRLGEGGYASDVDPALAAVYRPIGLWMLWPWGPPPAALVEALRAVAWVSTIAMLLGVTSRASAAISLVSALAIATFDASFTPTWSHHNNVPFLAQLAFLGARGGDALSVDAWLRRRRGLPPLEVAGYQASIRLVELALALVFLSAARFKLVAGGGTLRWALSDNLRHHLLARFDLIGVERTAAADWLLGASWRYQAGAMLNLIAQLMPTGAVLAVGRPWLRAAFGAFFVIEVLSLGIVMDLWNTPWLPLAVVFVDWDRLIAWWRARNAAAPEAAAAAIPAPRQRRILAWVTAFVVYDAVISFSPRIDQVLRTYPFSSFPMFARIRVKPPYDRHQTYELLGGRLAILSDQALADDEQRLVDGRHTYRTMWRTRNPDEARRRLAVVVADSTTRFASRGVRGARLWLTTYQAPAYPAPAALVPHDLAIIAELSAELRTVLGAAGRDSKRDGGRAWVEMHAVGLDVRDARLVAFRNGEPTPIAIEATRDGDRFYFARPAGALLSYAAEVRAPDGSAERWLIADDGRQLW